MSTGNNDKIRMKNFRGRISLVLILGLMLTGCYSTPRKMDLLTIGMSQDEARHVMGEPFSSSKYYRQETWIYHLWVDLDTPQARRESYEIFFEDGKIKQYGPATPIPKSLVDKSRQI